MEWFVKAFLRASLAWLGAGVSLGVAMAIHPAWAIYRTAHMHMNLLGFVTMMIFGIAYHVIPRFAGHPLHSRRLAMAQWWLANVGLALFVAGLALRVHPATVGLSVGIVGTGALLSAFACYVFIYNIWRTVGGPPARQAAAAQPAAPSVPVRLHRVPTR